MYCEPHSTIGITSARRECRHFGIKQGDRAFHTYIVGQTGTGKTSLLRSMIEQDQEQRRGFAFIDPHGDLATELGSDRTSDTVTWTLGDLDCPYGYNPLTFVQKEYRPLVASAILEALRMQWADAWGVRMEHVLRQCLLTLLERQGSTLLDVVPLLTKRNFRTKVLSGIDDEYLLSFWRDEYATMNYRTAADGVAPIANKLGALFANPAVRKALTNPEKPLRLRSLMDTSQPLIIDLARGRIGADVSNVVGGIMAAMIAQAAYSRADIRESERTPYYLYIDEFHLFTSNAFASMFDGLRKYGLALIVAHQHISQLKERVREAVFGNVGTVIAFRVGVRDAPIISDQLGHRANQSKPIDPSHLQALPNYQIYITLMIDGTRSSVFSAKTLPPSKYFSTNHTFH